jgi:hypothetical protein
MKANSDFKNIPAIGCGICGYTPAEIKPMFRHAPANCILPDGWKQ